MRIGNTFTNMTTSSSSRDYSSFSLGSPSPASHPPRSPWHTPVPYLLGGLAAMMGLIAFALLFLVCSYWNLSGYLEGEEDQGDNGVENDSRVFEEKFLVIMAGEVKPTHLATPSTGRTSLFGSEKTTAAEAEEEGPDGRRDQDDASSSTDSGL